MPNWKKSIDGVNYTIEVRENCLEFTRDEGSPESYGGNSILAKKFITSNKWKSHVKEIFGQQVLLEVLNAAESAAQIESPVSKRFDYKSSCPYCGKPLRTSKAKQCPHCFKSWHKHKE